MKGSSDKQLTKICCACGLEKIVPDNFCKETQTKDGFHRCCKTCAYKSTKEWKARHPEKFLNSHRKNIYKIDFNTLWEKQCGLCASCGQPMLPSGKDSMSVVIDHDRNCCPGYGSCGKCVRGLIHNRCNRVIGTAIDDVELLKAAVAYLERWQAVRDI